MCISVTNDTNLPRDVSVLDKLKTAWTQPGQAAGQDRKTRFDISSHLLWAGWGWDRSELVIGCLQLEEGEKSEAL